jgi:tripeptide aminopeptidase
MNTRFLRLLAFALLCSVVAALSVRASSLADNPKVKAALALAAQIEPQTIEQQIAFCEIPAPPFTEQVRADYAKAEFIRLGLENVRIDEEGNVLGERPGKNPDQLLVFSAHLDTVFPEGTDTTVKREGALLIAPGITDDCRGLAVLWAVIKVLQETRLETDGTILFVATVGEEGLGDLRGVRHLFKSDLAKKITQFISLDGTGLGVTSGAVGSHRYEVTFHGPGGHSYGAFGLVNPIHALGRTIAKIAEFQVPVDPKTTFNVGTIEGGTSVNAIPHTAILQMDMRSPDAESLDKVDAMFQAAVQEAVAEENAFWAKHNVNPVSRSVNNAQPITATVKSVGNRPTGKVSDDAPILEAVRRANAALGIADRFAASSTDSNIPISLGVPAVTLSSGGKGVGAHSLDEKFDMTDSAQGTQRALLTLLEIVGLAK